MPPAGIDQGRGNETDFFECGAIPAQRDFILGATVDIFEGEMRYTSPGDQAQFLDRKCVAEVRAGVKPTL